MEWSVIAGASIGAYALVHLLTTMVLRRVVPTNEVHIVQSRHATKSYGKDSTNGNVYYAWPAWVPALGITQSKLPTAVFKLGLDGYDAYDKDKVPFEIDLVAFFRIADANVAAQRVQTLTDLEEQLRFILRGAARSTLASHDINTIMVERSKFGEQFTQEVHEQLKNWGVETVKNIELMDIRDTQNSKVISNIMAKMKSQIEMDSRITVAENMRKAQVAEIEAKQSVDIQGQIALENVGKRVAEKDMNVGITNQRTLQAVKEEEKVTQQKHMEVLRVQEVQTAEINRDVNLTQADQNKKANIIQAEGVKQTNILAAEQARETAILMAQGEKERLTLVAEGNLETAKKHAEGVELEGKAKGAAETAIQMAPVTAQTTLADKIGANKDYQSYLITIKQVEAQRDIGVEQAKALEKANIKVMATAGTPAAGVKSVMDLFSANGGTALASTLEALAQSDQGKKLINRFLPGDGDAKS